MMARLWPIILLSAAIATGPAAAQTADEPFDLSIPLIMRGPELVGEPPSDVHWSDDSRWIYVRWKPGGLPWHEPAGLYRARAAGGAPERLAGAAADSAELLLAGGDVSADERWRVVSHRGDLHLIDRRSMAVRRLTQTRTPKSSPVFSRDGRTVYYVAENNLFSLSLRDGTLRQLTDLQAGPPPAARAARGQRRFLEEQERTLFEHIRVREARRAQDTVQARARAEREGRTTVHLDRDERVAGLAVEAGGRYAVISTAVAAQDARRTVVPFWITESAYTEAREFRTRVGDAQPTGGRMGIVEVGTGDVRWLDVAAAAAPDPAANDSARFGVTRFLGWNEQGSAGLVGAVSADGKQAWLWAMDAASGELSLLTHLADEAWVGGPCAFWLAERCAGWLPDGRRAYFVSERDGYAHLYTVAADGSDLRQLTHGPWEVHGVAVAPGKDRFYLTTGEQSPHERHFYHMGFDGSNRVRITNAPGRHDATPAPDGSTVAIVHSFANRPPELFVVRNRPRAEARRITTSPTAAWSAREWIVPEIVHIPARDGARVPARIYRPADVGAAANGAAVIFVHGAGYLQNVHNWWSSYYREYMFHHLLAERGYIVLDIDYRASAGYGRDWRTAIYRHMGGKDLDDHVDGARWLQQNFGIDPERIGIYGGSYGGFITLMALFTHPQDFGAGAALRAVTDWAHYTHTYTGRILNLPQDDTAAYRRSSPIHFADGLEDPLLITHGMVDVNVHFSDVVRLAQRLIELGKTDWELAVYPVEDHAFVEPTSWSDQYRRILELFENHLHRTATVGAGPDRQDL
jgi:dipeptidyl aminopeptidase/acylaminoacyl peptidase